MHVVLPADEGDAEAAGAVLMGKGAGIVDRRLIAPGRVLLYARFVDEGEAERVVASLRSEGWSAAARPESGGHLSTWQTHTGPVRISERLWVCFPWSELLDDWAAVVLIKP